VSDLEQRLVQRMREIDERVAANTEMLKVKVLLYNRDRRDRIATAALAGMLANPSTPAPSTAHHATWAVAYADALIAELDKEVQP
jgi:hypothetical protein